MQASVEAAHPFAPQHEVVEARVDIAHGNAQKRQLQVKRIAVAWLELRIFARGQVKFRVILDEAMVAAQRTANIVVVEPDTAGILVTCLGEYTRLHRPFRQRAPGFAFDHESHLRPRQRHP